MVAGRHRSMGGARRHPSVQTHRWGGGSLSVVESRPTPTSSARVPGRRGFTDRCGRCRPRSHDEAQGRRQHHQPLPRSTGVNAAHRHPGSEYNSAKEAAALRCRAPQRVSGRRTGSIINIICPAAKERRVPALVVAAPTPARSYRRTVPTRWLPRDRRPTSHRSAFSQRHAHYLTGNTLFVDGGKPHQRSHWYRTCRRTELKVHPPRKTTSEGAGPHGDTRALHGGTESHPPCRTSSTEAGRPHPPRRCTPSPSSRPMSKPPFGLQDLPSSSR